MLRLKLGSQFPQLGWTVTEILRDGVIVRVDNRSHKVLRRIVEELIEEGAEVII